MEAIFSIGLIIFLILIFMLFVGVVLSANEFNNRNDWRVENSDGAIDWKRVDAGKFAFYLLVNSIKALFLVIIALAILMWGVNK